MRIILATIAFLLFATPSWGSIYSCPVSSKWDTENTYSQEMIDKWKYTVLISEHSDANYLSRCSNDSSGKFTCEEYKVDRIETSSVLGSDIRKYYVFASQFDVQLFEKTMIFIENNGRGSIAMGTCSLK